METCWSGDPTGHQGESLPEEASGSGWGEPRIFLTEEGKMGRDEVLGI